MTVTSGKAGRKISQLESDLESAVFVIKLNKLLINEIVITPDIANVNPYKPVSIGSLVYSLILLAIALDGIYAALKALFYNWQPF